ncbi:hypothetical protein, partial [Prevotella corporis]|uniref:hypothetical protein n=1 Tax=Prevotella corporis TaxID=28128 RepID=UPI0031E2B5C3
YASRTSASLGEGYSFIALRFGTCKVTYVGHQAVWQRSKFGLKMPIKLLDSSPSHRPTWMYKARKTASLYNKLGGLPNS